MFNVFQRTLKEKKWAILIYCIAGISLLLLYIAFFPTVQQSATEVSQLVKSLPESLVKTFGLDAQSFITFEGFIAGKHYSLVWPVLLIALVVSFGGSFLAGEIEKGTIELLLSQPVSRLKIFFGKFFAGIANLLIFIVASVLAVFPLAKTYNINYKSEAFLKLALIGFIFGLAIFGLSMFFSAIFSEKSKVTFSVVGILITMYVLNIVAGLKESLDKLKYFSFFHYFNASEVLVYNKINHWAWWVFLGTFLISTILALIWFQKKDVAI
jgi:ABC-2 type transport system permease protein